MTSKYQIDNVASKVVSAKNTIMNKNTNYQAAANLKYWQGDIANSFKNARTRINTKMNTLQSNYNTLNFKLTNLSNAVQRAETKRQINAK